MYFLNEVMNLGFNCKKERPFAGRSFLEILGILGVLACNPGEKNTEPPQLYGSTSQVVYFSTLNEDYINGLRSHFMSGNFYGDPHRVYGGFSEGNEATVYGRNGDRLDIHYFSGVIPERFVQNRTTVEPFPPFQTPAYILRVFANKNPLAAFSPSTFRENVISELTPIEYHELISMVEYENEK